MRFDNHKSTTPPGWSGAVSGERNERAIERNSHIAVTDKRSRVKRNSSADARHFLLGNVRSYDLLPTGEEQDSPIETIFLDTLLDHYCSVPSYCDVARWLQIMKESPALGPHTGLMSFDGDGWLATTQLGVRTDDGHYRLDVAIVADDLKFAVELDGFAFHHATKEQVQRDKRRDRALTRSGWHVLRYTGSEVFADAKACIEDLDRTIRALQPAEILDPDAETF